MKYSNVNLKMIFEDNVKVIDLKYKQMLPYFNDTRDVAEFMFIAP